MAWQKLGGGYNGDAGGEAPFYWYNNETGETSQFDPTPSGQYKQVADHSTEGQSNQMWVDSVTGRPVTGQEAQLAEQQQAQQKEAEFMKLWNDPNASSFEKARAVHLNYGIETLAQLAKQGQFSDVPELGAYIAARQREANDAGFTVNGNKLGLWPVALGTALFGGLAAAGYGAETAGAGSTAATTSGGGVSASAGPEFTGGLSAGSTGSANLGLGGTAASAPGLAAPSSFSAASLGAGGAATAPGLAAPAAATGAGALGTGFFAGESAYPVLGGVSAASGASGLGTSSLGSTAAGAAGAATASDWLRLAGTLGAAGLGAYASNNQSQSLEDLANRYMDMGAPARARYEASYAPGFSMASDPGYVDALDQVTKASLRGMSAQHGNPFGSPTAWSQTLKDVNAGFAYPAMQNYRSMNANAGGLSRFAEAAPNAAMAGIGAQRGVYDAIGSGAADILTPRKTLADLLKEVRY